MNNISASVSAEIVAEPTRFEMVPHWIMGHPEITGNALRVYLQLRKYADSKAQAFPSRKRLADDLGLSIRTVDVAKEILLDIGAIDVVARVNASGEQTSNLYTVKWEQGEKFAQGGGAKNDTGGVQKDARGGCKNLHTNLDPINLDPLNLDISASAEIAPKALVVVPGGSDTQDELNPVYGPLMALFDTFWQEYPRKQAKGAARKAWSSAVRKERAVAIIEAARRYRDDPNRQDEFTPHPATWLNGERWSDVPMPTKRRDTGTAGDKRMNNYQSLYAVFERESVNELEGGK